MLSPLKGLLGVCLAIERRAGAWLGHAAWLCSALFDTLLPTPVFLRATVVSIEIAETTFNPQELGH